MANTAVVSIDEDVNHNTAPFYSENNMNYLNKVINGIETGTRPLSEHDMIEE